MIDVKGSKDIFDGVNPVYPVAVNINVRLNNPKEIRYNDYDLNN